MSNDRLRLAELMASLSLAIDLGAGQPMEWVMRACLLGVRISQALGLSEQEQQDVYYLSLLRYIGCTSTAAGDAILFGDELGVAELITADMGNAAEIFGMMIRLVGKGQPPLKRMQTLARMIRVGSQVGEANHLAHCEVAENLAGKIGFDRHIQEALWQIYERWDGKGSPRHLRGEALFLAVRVIHLAQDTATFYSLKGMEAAVKIARERAGRLYDPEMVRVFCQQAGDLLSQLDGTSAWEAVLGAEPAEPIWLVDDEIDSALQALADFADLKSTFTGGHSRSVSRLVEAAARAYGLPETDVIAVRRAGLVHDLGKVGVTAGIWEKGGTLTDSEQEQVRLHPYFTERIFARSAALKSLGNLGAMHHERMDGSGYHRNLQGAMLPIPARLLGVANSYCALLEDRPHRPACSPSEAAKYLLREGEQGRLDSKAVHAVLEASGHRVLIPRQGTAAQLSPREIEVLRLMARGLSNRQMASQLSISEKTVGHHVQHIYNKIGVSTRAGATLFAIQHDLLSGTL